MLVSEEQAKAMRCCGPPVPGVLAGRAYCIASACMAWQERGRFWTAPDGRPSETRDLAGTWPETRIGCCGLAPEPIQE